MFCLYLKTHNKTGLKYLGYTKNDPMTYRGSGLYWQRHIKKYGYDVNTETLFTSTDIDEIAEMGLYYSELWDIVNNLEFANLCQEDGNKIYGKANPNFIGHSQSIETRKKISENNGKGNLGKFANDHPAYGHRMNDNYEANLEKARKSLIGKDVWNKGKTGVQIHSDETRMKMSVAKIGVKKQTVKCEYCDKEGGKPAMIRFHFNNCKYKPCV